MKNTEEDEMKRREEAWDAIFWYYDNMFKEIRILRNEIKRAIERYKETGEEKFRINKEEITSTKKLLNLFYEVEFSAPGYHSRLGLTSLYHVAGEIKKVEDFINSLRRFTRELERPKALAELEEKMSQVYI